MEILQTHILKMYLRYMFTVARGIAQEMFICAPGRVI